MAMGWLPSLISAVLAFAYCDSAFDPPTIPLNRATVYACAVDVPSRVLAHVVTTQYTDNTPVTCIERCDAANYTYAGVEYGNECHCGIGLVGTPIAPSTDCNMACTGDPTLSCGGSWRIQIYKSPALTPGGRALHGCFVDTSSTPAFAAPVYMTFASNRDPVGECINYCTHIGVRF